MEPVNPPAHFDPQPHILKAFDEIKNYTAMLIHESGVVASGVFVNACGFDGILTANHVAVPMIDESKHFALCIAQHEHGVWLKSETFEHVPIGVMNPNLEMRKHGPDLSFIIIRDAKLLATLRSLKSFCYLDNQKLDYFNHPLDRQAWVIAGSPDEARKIVREDIDKKGKLTKLDNWVGLVGFHSRVSRSEFDYVQVETWAGIDDGTGGKYPFDYQGVSGGGFWLVPFEIDPDENPKSISHAKPVLGGIAYHQSDPPVNQKRIITGHGFDSIYTNLIQILKSKR
jgi:hypothetical protein